MRRSKKITFSVLILVLFGLWWYWECPMTMDSLLPQENWIRVELRWCNVADAYYEPEFQKLELDKLLTQMKSVKLTRTEQRTYLDDQYFQINLFKGEAYPTMIYVGNTGRVQIARELDFDHWKHYEGGVAFYRFLENYSQTLPAVYDPPESE